MYHYFQDQISDAAATYGSEGTGALAGRAGFYPAEATPSPMPLYQEAVGTGGLRELMCDYANAPAAIRTTDAHRMTIGEASPSGAGVTIEHSIQRRQDVEEVAISVSVYHQAIESGFQVTDGGNDELGTTAASASDSAQAAQYTSGVYLEPVATATDVLYAAVGTGIVSSDDFSPRINAGTVIFRRQEHTSAASDSPMISSEPTPPTSNLPPATPLPGPAGFPISHSAPTMGPTGAASTAVAPSVPSPATAAPQGATPPIGSGTVGTGTGGAYQNAPVLSPTGSGVSGGGAQPSPEPEPAVPASSGSNVAIGGRRRAVAAFALVVCGMAAMLV